MKVVSDQKDKERMKERMKEETEMLLAVAVMVALEFPIDTDAVLEVPTCTAPLVLEPAPALIWLTKTQNTIRRKWLPKKKRGEKKKRWETLNTSPPIVLEVD